MSLINEALKKAQRMRHEGQPADASTDGGSGQIAKRKQAHKATTMLLVGSGALALIVLSVFGTVWLLQRPDPAPAPAPKIASAPPATAPATSTSSTPLIVPPVITPAPKPETAATVTPPEKSPASTPSTSSAPSAKQTPAASPAPVAATPATPSPKPAEPDAPAKPDERVTAFVDSIRVTGIRSSGNESRVLMNERVYRVNDIVERALGVRLVKVSADSLTFSDANGVTYVKYF